MRFTDQGTAAPPGTVIGQIGGYSFSEQCQVQGGGGVQATVSVKNPDRWLGFETSSTEQFPALTEATTLASPTASNGSLRMIATDLTPHNQSTQTGLDLELLDEVTNQVVDVHLGVLADGTSNLCAGIGAAIPAS